MEKNDFKLLHNEGKLTALLTIEGNVHEMDVTNYFETEEVIVEWLFYRRKQRRIKSNI